MPISTYLSCKQVAAMLRVSQSTVKRLCDSSLLTSVRTPGGHRRISGNSVSKWLQHGGFVNSPESVAMRESISIPTCDNFLELLLKREEVQALQCVENLRKRANLAHLCDRLFAPTMQRVGTLWAEGKITIENEHLASHRILALLYRISGSMSFPSETRRAVGSTPPGDLGEIGSMFAEVTLRELGWHASGLGPNLPGSCLASAARQTAAQIVWVSYSHNTPEEAVITHNRELIAGMPEHSKLIIGGSALSPDLRRRLSYSFFGDSMEHLRSYVMEHFSEVESPRIRRTD